VNPYLPLTDDDRETMLKTIGVKSFSDLITQIPADIPAPVIRLPEPLSEIALEKDVAATLAKNKAHDGTLSFLGGGVYDHYIPAVVGHLASRGEFFTAYTPYQAEASQGTLQVIYEYQTMIARLTDMAMCNASHYDGATSLAESVLMTLAHTGRKQVIVSRNVHPEYRDVLRTYLSSYDCQISELDFGADGTCDCDALAEMVTQESACFIAQSPNFFGVIEDYEGVKELLDKKGATFIIVSNPLSLGVCRTPGEWGADIACGDGQPLGNEPAFGGPHLGYIATTEKFMRKVPGRLVGMTEDSDGHRAFVLTLQAREQHIRRHRASSNICSNQALCALKACVYCASVGDAGLSRISEINVQNSTYLKDAIRLLKGCRIVFDAPTFNEFVLECEQPVSEVLEKCKHEKLYPGIALERWYPQLKNCLLMCATETKTKEDLDRCIAVLRKACKK